MQENPYRAPQTPSTTDGKFSVKPQNSDGHKPRIWTVFAVPIASIVGVFSLIVLFAVVAVTLMIRSGASVEGFDAAVSGFMESPLGYGVIVLVNQVPFFVVPMVAAWLSPVPLRRRLGLVPSGLTPARFAVVVLGVAAPFSVGLALSGFVEPDETFARAFDSVTWPTLIPLVAAIALLPGFAEEILFRGYMQRRLLERWSPWQAILVSSFCFALVHMELYGALFSLPPGIWLGWVAWKANSIWPTIVSHIAATGCWALTACVMRLTSVAELPLWFALPAGAMALLSTFAAVRILQTQASRAELAVLAAD